MNSTDKEVAGVVVNLPSSPLPRLSLPDVALSWNGLPKYAARLMRAAIDRLREDCIVIGSKPSVPVDVIEQGRASYPKTGAHFSVSTLPD